MTDYGPYSISVNEQQLQDEINAHPDIVPHCTITVANGQVTVNAKIALSAAGKTALDGGPTQVPQDPPLAGSVLGDHTPVPVSTTPTVNIINEDSTIANFPQTTRKTPIFQPSIIPPSYLFYGTTRGDDCINGIIGEGTPLHFKTNGDAGDTVVIDIQFCDYVYILGGLIRAWDSNYDDEVTLDIVFPASTPPADDVTGNAIIANGVFVPVAEGAGTHRIDGNIYTVGQINQNLCPVPVDPGTGLWNWDPYADPSITPSSNGDYHLIPAEVIAVRQANKYAVKDGDVTPAAGIQGKKVLPHWIWRFTLKRGAEAGVTKANITLYTARKITR